MWPLGGYNCLHSQGEGPGGGKTRLGLKVASLKFIGGRESSKEKKKKKRKTYKATISIRFIPVFNLFHTHTKEYSLRNAWDIT